METRIIEALLREGRPMSPEALMECFERKDEAASAIEKLILEGRLILTRKRKLALPEQTGLIYGRVQGSARGYGFFIPEAGGGDMFIPADAMHGAMHNDMVWARAAETSSHNGTQEAEVALIAIRALAVIVGNYEQGGSEGGYVVPDEPRVCFDLLVAGGRTLNAKNGDKVVAKITRYPDGRRPMLGEITEILGAKDDARADMLSIIRRLELPDVFPKNATRQAKALNRPVTEDAIALREDLRTKLIITIDGADAKDLDDAVSLTRLADGWILGVHIADVSSYVAEGTPLDEEAYRRGTSVYFPDRVLPMFPKELSNGACSLNEGEDKLTFSCIMRLDAQGQPVSHRMADTVIRTAHRMTYDDVNALLDGDAELCEKYADVLPMLTDMKELAAILHDKRVKRGCLDFDLDEADITLDAQGRAVDVKAAVRGVSNRMIEQFMLEANETVAAHAAAANIPMMYRVHETPDMDKLNELNMFLNTLGFGVKSMGSAKPALLQKILLKAKDSKDETLVARVMLRSMKKARYAKECLGHYGLAAEYYCHFTSPIRRYPDLVVHRMMKLLLSGGMTAQLNEKYASVMEEMARRCSDRELVAMEAERAADDLKKCEYMVSRIGSIEKGLITGVAQYGFFVRLSNTAEGMVRVASLAGDYFECDEKRYRIVGRNTGRAFRLGDEVRVRVIAVDVGAGTIDFELANGTRGGTLSSTPAETPSRKPKKKTETKRRLARGEKS